LPQSGTGDAVGVAVGVGDGSGNVGVAVGVEDGGGGGSVGDAVGVELGVALGVGVGPASAGTGSVSATPNTIRLQEDLANRFNIAIPPASVPPILKPRVMRCKFYLDQDERERENELNRDKLPHLKTSARL
jgi:hypothetical protein